MSAQSRYFKIGLFILAGAALLVAGLLFLGADSMFRPRVYLETYVDGTVQGIDVGSPVKFRGVQIGRVSRVDFCFNEYGPNPGEGRLDYVYIEMEVNKQVFRGMFDAEVGTMIGQAVDQGLRVMLQPQGITGLNFAELNYVDRAPPPPLEIWWTPRHPYIPSAPGTLASMLDSVNSIMDTFKALDIKDTVRELNAVMENFNTTLGKLQTNLDEMNIAETSTNLQKLIDEMRTKVAELPVEQLGEDGRQMMETVTAAAGEMQGLVDRLERNPLLNEKAVGGIVRDFQSTAANFRLLSESLRDTPSLILWGKPPKRTVIEPRSRQ